MTSCVGFQHQVGRRAVLGGAGRALRDSSSWSCIPRKRACWNSAAMRPTTGGDAATGSRRRFNFLGFTHICGKKRSNGRFTVLRQTIRKRLQAKLQRGQSRTAATHAPTPFREQGTWLRSGRRRTRPLLRRADEQPGAAHVSVPGRPALASHALGGASQNGIAYLGRGCSGSSTAGCRRPASVIRIPASPWRHHLRQEPDAGNPLVRICGGGAQ